MGDKIFVKNLLICKNYKTTLESFSEEEKNDRPKKKSRYFVELIQTALSAVDFELLQRLWEDLEVTFFKLLDYDKQRTVDILKSDLYKAYLVECSKNRRHDKIVQFYCTMGDYILANETEWSLWNDFMLTKNHNEHKVFGKYFSRFWLDNFLLSLFNFFMQVVRTAMNHDNSIDRFFGLDMKMDILLNSCNSNEGDSQRLKSKLPFYNAKNSDFCHDYILSQLDTNTKQIHDVSELLCDFRLCSERRYQDQKKLSKLARPKGTNFIIQNKAKISSPVIRKKIIPVNQLEGVTGSRDSLEKIDELPVSSSGIYTHMSIDSDSTVIVDCVPNISTTDGNPKFEATPINISPKISTSSTDTFGIRHLSQKISTKIFKPKSSVDNSGDVICSKPVIYHEHFSMVSHVRFNRNSIPDAESGVRGNRLWASLDVGGTFKVWSVADLMSPSSPRSLTTLSLKHTIYSFDWLGTKDDLVLLGTKGGTVKLYDASKNSFVNEMQIDSLHPRVNIVHSWDTEAKFVTQSLDRSRSTLTGSVFPRGVISLYDADVWRLIHANVIESESDASINCLLCVSDLALVSGSSNGSVHLTDLRTGTSRCQSTALIGSEVIGLAAVGFWQLACLSSAPRVQLRLLDRRYLSAVASLSEASVLPLSELQLPISWAERPGGGQQIVHVPRSGLLAGLQMPAPPGLVAAAGSRVSLHRTGSNWQEKQLFNCDHGSPIISIDTAPVTNGSVAQTSPEAGLSQLVVTGSMEGTCSVMRLSLPK